MSMMRHASMLHHVDDSQVAEVITEMDRVLGSLDDVVLRGQDVMLAIFIRPSTKKLSSGLILHTAGTGQEQAEDCFQGTIARIVKLGRQAFNLQAFPKSLADEWGDIENIPKVGDWVYVDAKTGIQGSYKGSGSQRTAMFDGVTRMPDDGGWPIRIVSFSDIIAKVAHPAVLV